MQNKQPQNDGFVIVASKQRAFYLNALYLIESIKDYDPDAKTCLVVDEHISDDRVSVSDHVIYTEVPDDYRAKLWGMSKTPFDRTMYLDADMECAHEDVKYAFDQLGDNDMMFSELTEERDKTFENRHFPAGSFRYNGGVCLYNSSNPKVIDFMYRWWELFTLQYNNQWWPTDPETGKWDLVNYGDRNEMRYWDQFTLWWLFNREEKWSDLKVGVFEDDLRWNWYSAYGKFGIRPEGEPVFVHWSNVLKKDNVEHYEAHLL